jgi:hypothetical protein
MVVDASVEPLTGGAFLRIGDGDPIPVSSVGLDMDRPFAGTPSSGPLFAGQLSNFAFGFKADLGPESVEFWRAATAGCPVDPNFDEHFADWRCPGCGAEWAEVPAGHSWWRNSVGQWSCKQ